MWLLHVIVFALALPALVLTGYLALLTVLSARLRAPALPARRHRFDVVVPAHDEEAGIARTVRNLLAVDWPRELFRVLVVADNCSDKTAERAAEAGAHVLVRTDRTRRGKGYALEHAFARVLADGFADAAVVVDADTTVTPNLLGAFAARLEAGAHAVQAEYAVLNFDASWRTRLMSLAFALFHHVRSAGRERLRVSCGLRGNGMCFSTTALRRVPHNAFSIVEDLEYGLRLGQAGIRVHYAHEARVFGEMVTGAAASVSQRRRWEGGRLAIVRQHGMPLLARAARERDPVLLDLAFDVMVPPLSWICAYTVFGAWAAGMLLLGHMVPASALAAWLVPSAFLVLYVLRGVQVSGMGFAGLVSLAWAPAFVAWKILIMIASPIAGRGEWVRTARESSARESV